MGKKKYMHSIDDDQYWDDEKKAKRFMITHLLGPEGDSKTYKQYMKDYTMEDLANDKNTAGAWEIVDELPEGREVKNWTTRELYREGNPFEDIEDLYDKLDKEDIPDEEKALLEKGKSMPEGGAKMVSQDDIDKRVSDDDDDFEGSLAAWLKKHPKGRDDIPVTVVR